MRESTERVKRVLYQPGSFVRTYSALLLVGVTATILFYAGMQHFLLDGRDLDATRRIDLAKVALTVVGGAGAIAVLYVSYRRQRTDEVSGEREQDRLFTDRFTKASEQLGHASAAVRLAGVYALARIADDSTRDRQTCMRTLTAYLRMPYEADLSEWQVRKTVAEIITKRLDPKSEFFWDDDELDLRGAYLPEFSLSGIEIKRNVRLEGATFHGWARFSNTTFVGRVDFEATTFEGWASFSGAIFNEDTFFDGAKFEDRERATSFVDSIFRGVAYFEGCSFAGEARFSAVRFEKAAVFRECTFRYAHFGDGAHYLEDADFSHSRFGSASFSGARIDCESVDFGNSEFENGFAFREVDARPGLEVNLREIDMSRCRADVLTASEFEAMRVTYDDHTSWPRKFMPPNSWERWSYPVSESGDDTRYQQAEAERNADREYQLDVAVLRKKRKERLKSFKV